MSALMIAAGVITAALGLALCGYLRSKAAAYAEELARIRREYTLCSAVVLDVHKEKTGGRRVKAVIVQFRIEAEKRTVVHRITDRFYKSYKRGDNISILFLEGKTSDRGIIADDNVYIRCERTVPALCPLLAAVSVIAGAAAVTAGIGAL
ncbi:MAG: hypothetical protein NC120_11695 [Ruminococcus sp.]|nr:hypothetical protein [Ruminococcus sp.]